jgi:hypothetical protein
MMEEDHAWLDKRIGLLPPLELNLPEGPLPKGRLMWAFDLDESSASTTNRANPLLQRRSAHHLIIRREYGELGGMITVGAIGA